MNYNHITLVGVLGRDAETKDYDDKVLVKFTLCVTGSTKKGEEWVDDSQWFNVQMWAKNTTQAKMLTKGVTVLVDGKMRSTKYEKDGVKKEYWYVQASSVQTQPTKKSSDSKGSKKENEGEPQPVAQSPKKEEIPF